jgi:O-acetyl-ADP-ribose deacetylase (regulator of RNase III)
MPEGAPSLEEVITDLRLLRERGLVRIRHTELRSLNQAAALAARTKVIDGGPRAVEALLRLAVENLGGGSLAAAATATFGLSRGESDRAAQDRRRKAAMVYGVSVERFRKHHERVVVEQVAEEILKIYHDHRPHGPSRDGRLPELGRRVTLAGQAGGARFPVVVHTVPVELLSDVDIVVVSQNTYLEVPQHFKSSVAAAVRRSAARRADDGQIVADVVGEELREWIGRHGRPGLPVAPGTVLATSSGAMADRGIRRLYHAAIASPRLGTNDYDIEPTVLAQAVRNVLTMASAERDAFGPPLTSVGFPLLGAGRGGLSAATSFSWLWAAIEREISESGPWDIHFITRHRAMADLVVAGLTEAGATPA